VSRALKTTGAQKQATFKQAFDAVNQYKDAGNFLAAYVVSFSVIEDRLRALYVVWYRSNKNTEPTQKQVNAPFSQLVSSLLKSKMISVIDAEQLSAEARRRNELIHSAMWNLDGFTLDKVISAIELARVIDKTARKSSSNLIKGNK
jgi:hypothetical protein